MTTVNSQQISILNHIPKRVFRREKEYKRSKKRRVKMRLNSSSKISKMNLLSTPKSITNTHSLASLFTQALQTPAIITHSSRTVSTKKKTNGMR